MAQLFKEKPKPIEIKGYTIRERIKILEDKVAFYENQIRLYRTKSSEAKTFEESDKYIKAIKDIHRVLIPLKNQYSLMSNNIN